MQPPSKRQPITIPVPVEPEEYDDFLANVVARCREIDPIQLLTGLAWIDLAVQCPNDRSPVILEFAHQLVLTAETRGSRPLDPDDLVDLRSRLERVIIGLPSEWLGVDVSDPRENLLRSVIRDEQIVRGKAAPYHQVPYIQGLFQLADDWLHNEFGITACDVNDTIYWLMQSLQERANGIEEEAHKSPNSEQLLRLVFDRDPFLLADPPSRVMAVLKLLAAAPGSHYPNTVVLPGQARLLPRDLPILEMGGNLYCFNIQPVIDELPVLLDEWLKAKNQRRYQSFVKAREKHAVELALGYLSRAFTGCRVGQNLFYTPPGEERCEVDGLLIYNDIAIIIEAKGARLTQKARSGHGKRLERDYEKLVTDSLCQGLRAKNFIEKDADRVFTDNGGSPVLNLRSRPSETYVVNLVLDNIDPLAVGLREARECGLLPDSATWPWTVTLADLNTVTSVLDTPSVLLLYLSRRQQFNDLNWLAVHDEIDLLGYYLDHGMPLGGAPQDADLFLYQYDPTELWAFLGSKLTGRLDSQKPTPPFGDEILDIARTLEESQVAGSLRVSRLLLGAPPDFREQIVEQLQRLASRVVEKGNAQAVSMITGSTGLSIWISERYDGFDRHGILEKDLVRKYEKCLDEWISVLFLLKSDGLEVGDIMIASDAWVYDASMESKVCNVRDDRFEQMSDRVKPNRNAPCPCGSGMKYKKCHGK